MRYYDGKAAHRCLILLCNFGSFNLLPNICKSTILKNLQSVYEVVFYPLLLSSISLNVLQVSPLSSTFRATPNTCLMQCEMLIQKALFSIFSRALAKFITAQRLDLKARGRGGVERQRRGKPERDRGGRSRRPGDIPAHLSDSHLPQRARCLLHGRLAAPPPPSPPLSKVVQAHSVSILSVRNTSEPAGVA